MATHFIFNISPTVRSKPVMNKHFVYLFVCSFVLCMFVHLFVCSLMPNQSFGRGSAQGLAV